MSKSKYPPIKVSDILRFNFSEYAWRETINRFGNLKNDDELDAVDLLKWGRYTYWLIHTNLINLSHQDAVILYANPQEITFFADRIKGADIAKIEDTIIDCANIDQMRFFAKHIKGANKARLNKAIKALTV